MNIDVNAVLVIALVISIAGHVVLGLMYYKLFQAVIRAISPSLRHPRTEPMPQIRASNGLAHRQTEDLGAELIGMQR